MKEKDIYIYIYIYIRRARNLATLGELRVPEDVGVEAHHEKRVQRPRACLWFLVNLGF